MKLILEAIKSLFRGVDSSIKQTAAALSKRIDKAQSTADTAKKNAAKAQAAVVSAHTWKEALYILTGETGEYSVVLPKFTELKIIGGLKNSSSTMNRMSIALNGYNFAQHSPYVDPKKWCLVQTEICTDVDGIVVVKNVADTDVSSATGRLVTGSAFAIYVTDNNTLVLTLPAELTVYNRPLRVLYR